jgi:Single-strand binding protein family
VFHRLLPERRPATSNAATAGATRGSVHLTPSPEAGSLSREPGSTTLESAGMRPVARIPSSLQRRRGTAAVEAVIRTGWCTEAARSEREAAGLVSDTVAVPRSMQGRFGPRSLRVHAAAVAPAQARPSVHHRPAGGRRSAMNSLSLVGNLTRDPELRYTPDGTAICELRAAHRRGGGRRHPAALPRRRRLPRVGGSVCPPPRQGPTRSPAPVPQIF